MRYGILILVLGTVSSILDAAIYETVYEDLNIPGKSGPKTLVFTREYSADNGGELFWEGGTLALDIYGGFYVEDSATSDFWGIVSADSSESHTELVFSAENPGQYVAPGETVTLYFDIELNQDSLGISVEKYFNPLETDEPGSEVPEPAILIFSVLGFGIVCRRH